MDILQLKTIQHLTISIDDVQYDLISPKEMSLKAYQVIINKGDKLYDMLKKIDVDNPDEIKNIDGEKLELLLNEIVREVVPNIPDDVFAKLSDMQKMEIMKLFPKLAKGQGDTSQETAG
jgi:magnesium-transporting ATPase (P-type)